MKQILLLACGLLMSFSAQAQSFENAKDAVKNMGVGWNLGNTLDANDASKTWTTTEQHETCWGQPVTKPELMKMMKEAGFNSIRVPVTWYQEMDSDGNVNEAWMNRVKEVVDYVIDTTSTCCLRVTTRCSTTTTPGTSQRTRLMATRLSTTTPRALLLQFVTQAVTMQVET